MHADVLPTWMFTTSINTSSVHGGQKRASDVRELELQTPVSHVGFRELNLGSLKGESEILTTETTLQPHIFIFYIIYYDFYGYFLETITTRNESYWLCRPRTY